VASMGVALVGGERARRDVECRSPACSPPY
jgi:hypothetical protein